jgi:hypothetical protein
MTIDYDGRLFAPAGGDPADRDRRATYRQDGDLLAGEFSGGRARAGRLTGLVAADGTLDFAYSMVLDGGEVVSGRCLSTPRLLPDGRIQLQETWERYGPGADTGVSVIEELVAESGAA